MALVRAGRKLAESVLLQKYLQRLLTKTWLRSVRPALLLSENKLVAFMDSPGAPDTDDVNCVLFIGIKRFISN